MTPQLKRWAMPLGSPRYAAAVTAAADYVTAPLRLWQSWLADYAESMQVTVFRKGAQCGQALGNP